jgi:hypothetical protein
MESKDMQPDNIRWVIQTYTMLATFLACSTPPPVEEVDYYGRWIPRMWKDRWNEWCY